MSASRSWFLSPLGWTVALALATAACGDGGGTITPPQTEKPVASLTVTPATASVQVTGTVQLTATLFDAQGNTLTGRNVTWSSSSQAVATVNQTGLVTGAGGGEVTVTATAEGRSGTAAVTVTQPLAPGVVAGGAVGAAGGSVGTPDVGVSIPAGQLSTAAQIQILTSDEPIEEFGSDLVTGRYRLLGFPTDRVVNVRVRLRITSPLREQTFIGLGVPVVASSMDTEELQPGFILREAVDSAGYLVATLPVRGRGSQASPQPSRIASVGGVDHLLDGLLGGVTGVRTDTVPGKQFVIVSYGAPRAELQPKVSRAAKLTEDARITLQGLGYSLDHRTVWPMEVHVSPLRVGLYGSFRQELPWPLDVNTGWFRFNTWAFDQPDMPGTAIHEFYHFVQARYTRNMLPPQYGSYGWVKEAGSTWIEEKAPETIGVFRNAFFQEQRHNLFIGLYPSLEARHGYGKAPIMMYAAKRWGAGQVKTIFESVGAGTAAIDAVLGGIPEAPATWWPDLLTRYMKGELVALDPDSLPPTLEPMPLKAGTWTVNNPGGNLRPLGAQFVHFTPKPDSVGTGTTLTLRLPPALHTAGFRILPFRMDASGKWEEQGGVADSLVIKGADLRLGRRYGIFVLHTTPTSPYTQSWSNQIVTDLGYVDGDWLAGEAEITEDGIVYDRTSQEDTITIDVADDLESVFMSLAAGGIWKRSEANPNLYVWAPTPEFASEMAAYRATLTSEAEVYKLGDSLRLNAVFDMAPPAAPVGEPGSPAALGGAGLLLLAGIAMRRRRRIVAAMFAGAFGLALWGCDPGWISFTARYRYELRFGNPALTASAEDHTHPLVYLDEGTGSVIVDRYRSEWMEYIRDDEGAIVDSVIHVRTASGQAKVKLSALLLQDGVVTGDEDDEDLVRDFGLPRVPSAAVLEAVGAARRR